MKPTYEQVILINGIIREAIDHGGDAGGPYFVNGDKLYVAMTMYRDNIWGRNSGISICKDVDDYPYFVSIVDEQ